MSVIFYPFVLFVVVILIFLAVAVRVLISKTQPVKLYHRGRQTYMPGEFSRQVELDLRLPYRRFMQLYPSSKLSYKEYKELQTRRAFRRSISSQDNKRMVR